MPITINGTSGISGVDGSAGTPAIQGTDTNTGVFYPASDTVGIATSGTEQLRVDSTGNLRFNSGYGSVVTAYGCRAWVNFNGTGTVAIRGSGNVTSITDNGTGDYRVNFTNAMPDVNYAVSLTSNNVQFVGNSVINTNGMLTSSTNIIITSPNLTTVSDNTTVSVAIFR